MKKSTCFILAILIMTYSFSQDSQEGGPYRLRAGIDAPIIIGGAGLSYVGLKYLREKKRLDSAYVATLGPEDVNRFDRSATRQNGEGMGLYSDIALFSSIALPFFLNVDKHIRSDALKVSILYVETMAVMANAYVWGVGSTKRIRPYVYNPDVPFEDKLRRGTTNSFFAGHCAAAAASSFFAAKVYNDYHPDSKLRKFFWAGALIPPAIVGYFRYKDGQHFLTDTLAGIPIGMTIGILVPHLHKKTGDQKTVLFPTPGGIGLIRKL